MRRALILLTSSYPYSAAETYLAHEAGYLRSAFDHMTIISNAEGDQLGHTPPPGVDVVRVPYHLTPMETLASTRSLTYGAVREELAWVVRRYRRPITRPVLATVLVAWAKALKVGRIIKDIAARQADATVCAYSYWANDMALAVAVARSRGWVDRAVCRAHGWDVYFERSAVGFLPFRSFLARHLDHYRFVSEDGQAYFQSLMRPARYSSPGCSRLGVPRLADAPRSRQRPFVLVSCSSAIPLKRLDLLVAGIAKAKTPLRWVHVGDGPELASVRGSCSGLPSHIAAELLGQRPNTELLELYRRGEVSALISVSSSEGLPVSMMEAMAAGIPVIATRVGGVPEIVLDSVNGILLSPNPAPADIGAAIDQVAATPESDYFRISMAALRTWEERFDAAVNYPQFLSEVCGAPASEAGRE